MTHPLVSVIIPVRNGKAYLQEALDSVLQQSFTDFELLLIDDGSSDDDYDRYALQDGRIRILHLPGLGVSRARNTGMEQAQGALLAFLDADDAWFTGKLQAQVDYFEQHPEVGVVFGPFVRWPQQADGSFTPLVAMLQDASGHTQADAQRSGWLYTRLLNGLLVGMNTAVVRRSVYQAVGGFNEAMRQGEDYDFWLKASRVAEMHSLNGPLALYRIHRASAMHRLSPDNHLAHLLEAAVLRWGLQTQGGQPLSTHAFQQRLGQVHFDHGYAHYWQGERAIARRAFWRALRCGHRPLRCLAYIALSLRPRR